MTKLHPLFRADKEIHWTDIHPIIWKFIQIENDSEKEAFMYKIKEALELGAKFISTLEMNYGVTDFFLTEGFEWKLNEIQTNAIAHSFLFPEQWQSGCNWKTLKALCEGLIPLELMNESV